MTTRQYEITLDRVDEHLSAGRIHRATIMLDVAAALARDARTPDEQRGRERELAAEATRALQEARGRIRARLAGLRWPEGREGWFDRCAAIEVPHLSIDVATHTKYPVRLAASHEDLAATIAGFHLLRSDYASTPTWLVHWSRLTDDLASNLFEALEEWSADRGIDPYPRTP